MTLEIQESSQIPLASMNGIALELKPDLTRDEWITVGQNLGRSAQGIQWFLGDWINFGVTHGYVEKDKYDIAEELTHLSRGYLHVCAWVARSYKPEDRRADLSFDHHKQLASIAPGIERNAILQVAAAQGISSRETYSIAAQVMSPQITIDEVVIPPQAKPPVRGDGLPLGEVIQLGPHRLIIGDATDPSILDALFAGESEQASVLWTDPPYGVNYSGKTEEALQIDNDHVADLPSLLALSFVNIDDHLRDGSALYICSGFANFALFVDIVDKVGWRFSTELIWVKNTFALGWGDYHPQHEAMIYAFKGDARRWYGPRNQSTVFGVGTVEGGSIGYTIPKPSANREHPTSKPPRLVFEMLRNSALNGEIVLDTFAGSGSTMIAAQQLGLRAFMVELDPTYAQVIIDRWEELHG